MIRLVHSARQEGLLAAFPPIPVWPVVRDALCRRKSGAPGVPDSSATGEFSGAHYLQNTPVWSSALPACRSQLPASAAGL
jgi:hypothetical protein